MAASAQLKFSVDFQVFWFGFYRQLRAGLNLHWERWIARVTFFPMDRRDTLKINSTAVFITSGKRPSLWKFHSRGRFRIGSGDTTQSAEGKREARSRVTASRATASIQALATNWGKQGGRQKRIERGDERWWWWRRERGKTKVKLLKYRG